eukprot:179287-Chlamydomonas_euryale.AAC.1
MDMKKGCYCAYFGGRVRVIAQVGARLSQAGRRGVSHGALGPNALARRPQEGQLIAFQGHLIRYSTAQGVGRIEGSTGEGCQGCHVETMHKDMDSATV